MTEGVEAIIERVCKVMGIERDDLFSGCSTRAISRTRHVLCHELRRYGLTLSEIAQVQGFKTHMAVSHHLRQYDNEFETNRLFRELVGKLKETTQQ